MWVSRRCLACRSWSQLELMPGVAEDKGNVAPAGGALPLLLLCEGLAWVGWAGGAAFVEGGWIALLVFFILEICD